eukprot:TRINITY_DN45674_c0_g1_i1.p1 TRINITY_DN45674_c0_g1~~TRINITY_DN45674_c0_g1_i1.p1  ORF type:complete len:415 (-),score=77.70 TRINITY_DN45674_c0_g1_i1:174-1418(-)
MDSSCTSDEDECEEPPVRIPLGNSPVIFAMPGSRDLAATTLGYLPWSNRSLGQCAFKVFGNGEISTKVQQSVSNHDVFVFCRRDETQLEVNFGLMQLLFFVNALHTESPHRLTIVMPCFDYSRQDRRLQGGEAIPPALLLRCLKTAGADRFLTIDLHNEAEAAFSPEDTVLDELSAHRYLADFIRKNVPDFSPESVLVCATNGGGISMTRRMADELRTGIMVADRFRPKVAGGSDGKFQKTEGGGRVKIMSSVGTESIKAVVIVDDLFDTCRTLVGVCSALRDMAPHAKIYAVATHGYFSGDAHLKVKEMVQTYGLQWVAVTNSVAQEGPMKRFKEAEMADYLKVVDISRLLAGALARIHLGASVNLPKFRAIGPDDEDLALSEILASQPQFSRVESPGASVLPPSATPPSLQI